MVVVASMTLVAGCSLGSQDEDGGSETVTVTSSSSSTPTQETHTETATGSPTSPPSASATPDGDDDGEDDDSGDGLPSDPGSYADGFVRAWGIGDREDASRYATASSVSTLFAIDTHGGSSWTRTSTARQGDRSQVSYSDGEGFVLHVLVDRETAAAGEGDAVVSASLEYEGADASEDWEADDSGTSVAETTAGTYCDALVRAWGSGDRGTADDYATAGVMTQLFDDYGTGGSGWSQTSVSPSEAVYTNSDGTTLTLSFDSNAVEQGSGDAIHSAEIS